MSAEMESNGTKAVESNEDKKEESMETTPTSEDLKEKTKESTQNNDDSKEETKEATQTNDEKKEQSKETTPPTELDLKIIKQIEYYFGDINLARDKFLLGQIKADNGWVPLETMVKFNRLKQLSEDEQVIAEAMKKSSSGLIEVSEDNTKIRRNPEKQVPEFNKERKDDLKTRTLYVKPLPLEATLDDLQQYFGKYGSVEHIQMRKDVDKKFKGSVFVLFESKEAAEKLLKEEGTKYTDDSEIETKMFKDDYFKSKLESRKQVREQELKDKEEANKQQEEKEENDFKNRMTKGAILVLNEMPTDISRDKIKEMFKQYGACAWVDWDEEAKEARIRYEKEGSASEALKKAEEAGEGKVKVNDTEVKARILEGEEEEEHWKNMMRDMRSRFNRSGGGGRGRGGGRGMKRHHGHRGGRHSGGPHRKRAKTDD